MANIAFSAPAHAFIEDGFGGAHMLRNQDLVQVRATGPADFSMFVSFPVANGPTYALKFVQLLFDANGKGHLSRINGYAPSPSGMVQIWDSGFLNVTSNWVSNPIAGPTFAGVLLLEIVLQFSTNGDMFFKRLDITANSSTAVVGEQEAGEYRPTT